MPFLVTAFGKPFTANGFGNWFRQRCDEAGLPHCSAHGLRKAAAARLAELGAGESESNVHALQTIWRSVLTSRSWATVSAANQIYRGDVGSRAQFAAVLCLGPFTADSSHKNNGG
jgi:integrase